MRELARVICGTCDCPDPRSTGPHVLLQSDSRSLRFACNLFHVEQGTSNLLGMESRMPIMKNKPRLGRGLSSLLSNVNLPVEMEIPAESPARVRFVRPESSFRCRAGRAGS